MTTTYKHVSAIYTQIRWQYLKLDDGVIDVVLSFNKKILAYPSLLHLGIALNPYALQSETLYESF